MKLLKHKHFMSLIYSVLVSLPFFAILGRVIYTQSNKNAFESYDFNESLTLVDDSSQLIGGEYYHFNSTSTTYNITNNVGRRIYTDEILNFSSNYTSLVENFSRIKSFNFTYYSVNYFVCYDESNTQLYAITLSQYFVSFDFRLTNSTIETSAILPNSLFKITKITLDNAFEYSISTFTQDNNFGNLDFFSWFSNIFLDTSNTHNMLYINFINWYMNYTLFISLAYVLFLVLMWFVSFARRLLENTQNMNIGGL